MPVKFYLKRPKAEKETAIYALVNYNNNSIKIYTGESILPKYWNSDNNCARNTPKFSEHPEFNERLLNIRGTINKVLLDYKNNHNHSIPSPAVLKPLLEKALKKKEEKTTFLSYFEVFVTRSTNGQRLVPKTKKAIKPAVAKGYQNTLNHLLKFQTKSNRKIDFDTIDLEFHKDFTAYLSTAPLLLSANTIGNNFQRIKAVMSDATEHGVNTNMAFKGKHFIKQSEEVDSIYLNDDELKAMLEKDFSNNERLDNARDLFLIGCYTGLRFSDFSILKPRNIKDGYITITQTKTDKPVIIPIHAIVKDILIKRNGHTPRQISNVKLNKYLKEIGELLPCLEIQETTSITKGGNKVIKNVPKWKLLTTHTARRSFATNEFKNGTPSITIMAITGHKTETSFLKYIKVNSQEHADRIKKMWEDRDLKSKLKVV